MATANDIILRALRRIGVVAEDAPATDGQANSALDSLNAMMHSWKVKGADVEHVDYELATDIALGPEFHQFITDLLAERLCADFSFPITGQIRLDARDAWSMIWKTFKEDTVTTLPEALTCLPSQRRGFIRG